MENARRDVACNVSLTSEKKCGDKEREPGGCNGERDVTSYGSTGCGAGARRVPASSGVPRRGAPDPQRGQGSLLASELRGRGRPRHIGLESHHHGFGL